MSLLWASLAVIGFAVLFERLRLPARAREVGAHASATLKVIRDPLLDDGAKERALQRSAVRLFGLGAVILGGALLALGLPLGVIWLLDLVGLASFREVLGILERVDFLIAATVVALIIWGLARRLRGR